MSFCALLVAKVVQAFRTDKELRLFREWVMSPDEEELRAAAASPAERTGKRKRRAAQEDSDPVPGGFMSALPATGLPLAVLIPYQCNDCATAECRRRGR